MDISGYADAIEEHGRGLALAAGKAGPDAALPSCPEWVVADLLRHLGAVQRWAAAYVREGREGPTELGPAPADGLLDWFAEGCTALADTLRAAPAEVRCWSFLPAPSPLAFWARRQAHEAAIHRADVEAAIGTVPAYPAAFAADGLGELVGGFMARRIGKLYSERPCSLLVAPTDAPDRWHVAIGADTREVTAAELPADCTLRGPAADLYLSLWNREPAAQPEVLGDPAVAALWHERARVVWR
jgi:uncharacterized protein (TIGR03083 family)